MNIICSSSFNYILLKPTWKNTHANRCQGFKGWYWLQCWYRFWWRKGFMKLHIITPKQIMQDIFTKGFMASIGWIAATGWNVTFALSKEIYSIFEIVVPSVACWCDWKLAWKIPERLNCIKYDMLTNYKPFSRSPLNKLSIIRS